MFSLIISICIILLYGNFMIGLQYINYSYYMLVPNSVIIFKPTTYIIHTYSTRHIFTFCNFHCCFLLGMPDRADISYDCLLRPTVCLVFENFKPFSDLKYCRPQLFTVGLKCCRPQLYILFT